MVIFKGIIHSSYIQARQSRALTYFLSFEHEVDYKLIFHESGVFRSVNKIFTCVYRKPTFFSIGESF